MAERGKRKTRVGLVTSDKGDKTITVAVETIVSHPLYKKTLKRTKKLMADDQENQAGRGDLVEIMETRPLSKRKSWRLTKIIEKAK
jgi:small subunit ribosomal protein S17